jgi:hypothetical protein
MTALTALPLLLLSTALLENVVTKCGHVHQRESLPAISDRTGTTVHGPTSLAKRG